MLRRGPGLLPGGGRCGAGRSVLVVVIGQAREAAGGAVGEAGRTPHVEGDEDGQRRDHVHGALVQVGEQQSEGQGRERLKGGGYLAAGTVIEVGDGVEDRAVGDRVVTLNPAGSHASKRAVPATSSWPIPGGLDAAAAACVPVAFGTAQECLFTAGNLNAGQTALIHAGAGGVGMAAIQLAKQAGATVISTASSQNKLERLTELGLDHGINYAREDFVSRVRELTDGRGVDVILDSIGGENLVKSIRALAYRGTLISVGVAGRAGSDVAATDLRQNNNALRGVYLAGALVAE